MNFADKMATIPQVLESLTKMVTQLQAAVADKAVNPFVEFKDWVIGNGASEDQTASVAGQSIAILNGTDKTSTLYERVFAGDDAAWNDWEDLAKSTYNSLSSALNLDSSTSFDTLVKQSGTNLENEPAQLATAVGKAAGQANYTLILIAVILFLFLLVKVT